MDTDSGIGGRRTAPLPSSQTVINNPVNMLRAHGLLPGSRPPNHHGRTIPVPRHSFIDRRQSMNPASSGFSNDEIPSSDSRSFGSCGQGTSVVPVIIDPNNEVSHEAHGRPAVTNETASAVHFSPEESWFSEFAPFKSFQQDPAALCITNNEGIDTSQYEPQDSGYMMVDHVPGPQNGAGDHGSEQSWSKMSRQPRRLIPYADHHG